MSSIPTGPNCCSTLGFNPVQQISAFWREAPHFWGGCAEPTGVLLQCRWQNQSTSPAAGSASAFLLLQPMVQKGFGSPSSLGTTAAQYKAYQYLQCTCSLEKCGISAPRTDSPVPFWEKTRAVGSKSLKQPNSFYYVY